MSDIQKAKIVSAFPGTGKTFFVENSGLKCLDSDSSQFSKSPDFPDNYLQYIWGNIQKYDYIFISTHKEIRDLLFEMEVKYLVVYPSIYCKEEYISRYRKRGNTESFVKLLDLNWNDWIQELSSLAVTRIELTSNEYISDIFDLAGHSSAMAEAGKEIERLKKENEELSRVVAIAKETLSSV